MASGKRNILVVGATGKQGGATVRFLLTPPSPPDFHVWALTRKASAPAALNLVEGAVAAEAGDRLDLIEGDLEDPARIRKVFETINNSDGGLWGVYVAIAFPGLGVKDDREKHQGMMLAELALEFKVKAFVYSSALQPAPGDDEVEYSRISKREIESHCKSLTEKGLEWIILQPGFFMENFEGFLGSITTGILRAGLKKDTTIVVIASEDIGRVAAGVFANPEPYLHKTLGLTSGPVTMGEIIDAYKRGTGKAMSQIPAILARQLLRWNTDAQLVLSDLERHQESRTTGAFASYEESVRLGQSVCHLRGFEEWSRDTAAKGRSTDRGSPGWNKLSVFKLLTGRV